MVFKAKSKSDGSLDKLKARFCDRGDLEAHNDLFDNWSSCVSQRTVRAFIAHATKRQRIPKQLDFIGAYLQADMKSRIFVRLPKEYRPYFPDIDRFFNQPLLLNKTLYGLTVSAKYWNEQLVHFLTDNKFVNFQQSLSDPSLFSYINGNKWIHFVFYVDDGLYMGDYNNTEKEFFTEL